MSRRLCHMPRTGWLFYWGTTTEKAFYWTMILQCLVLIHGRHFVHFAGKNSYTRRAYLWTVIPLAFIVFKVALKLTASGYAVKVGFSATVGRVQGFQPGRGAQPWTYGRQMLEQLPADCKHAQKLDWRVNRVMESVMRLIECDGMRLHVRIYLIQNHSEKTQKLN